ncbi:magnesium/cobalt transporter CorA [Methanosarcina mazei]|mgnify:FL=1|uniref:Magnesium transport protein CorA n=6 Tax=Methanosarcina mazei TaxID=2209 RepID=A0A0F8G0L6_METMZ|nr:magnesium/cobalt transporter CorA [Methanosarcina mazei]AAM32336.1 Magnesium and cobalt transport protein CorA [Methanosarcina mazei Go1]AKB41325.1 Magnesium and cobalt transport protein CorA [Methanosarcina mazei WWM610]AKB65260.1 Magnesium and cobalt transport protein CorA [Methanosarcina mazei S-6]AKB68636.1 Magnesium and cobalt transport protein CorA [Methanosarcina mazei LYC]AKB70937.1 Magnesium and cobalt transport protein CorA [Methanosarcina mazei C16]
MKPSTPGRKQSNVGLAPGTLVHVGEKKAEKTVIKAWLYNSEKLIEKELQTVDECQELKGQPGMNLWINVDGLDQIGIIEKLGGYFGVHPLTLEDVLNTGQRPKMEDYDSYIYAVLKMMLLDEEREEILIDQVSIIFGTNYILSFQEREGDAFNPIRDRLKNSASRLRKNGVDLLAYSLIDAVVDNYFLILEHFGEEIEDLEEQLIVDPMPETLKAIQKYKRDMITLRRSVWPLRELINSLQRTESQLIKESTQIYLRDVYDHTIQVIDSIEAFRDILSSMVDVYLSSLSHRMNDIMKVLTIIATIFIPLTFIAGVYGMNFEYMPELKWRWGYPAVMFAMTILGISMFLYFKKRRWV